MKSAAVIPAYNEKNTIEKIIANTSHFVNDVFVINDGSTDSTKNLKIFEKSNVHLLNHKINLGKGAALKTGCMAALENGAKFLVCLDGDDQHKPEDIPRFIDELKKGHDIVFGSRKIGRQMPAAMLMGNKFLTASISKMFKIFINDTQSGYRAFTADAFNKISWESSDYAVETEMIINAAKHNLKYKEIYIDTIYHDKYKGTTPMNGISIFAKIIFWKIR